MIKIIEPISLIKNKYVERISYYDNGLVYSFVNSNVELNYAKPLKYNNENIEDLKKYLEQENSEIIQDNYDLNVIFVQLESFFDPTILNEIKFIKDPIPTFRELTDNYSSGLISVPTFGGSTVRSEFEILTSTNLDYFSPNEIPYNTIGKKVSEIYSLAHYFNELGYTTTAFHNNTETFFNRKMIFSKMQFNEFLGLEQLIDIEPADTNWYEDAGLIPYIANRIQQTDEKDFIMGITVQLHGPYDKEYSISHNEFMDNSYEGEEYNQLAYYLDTISKIDDAIEDMINMINELDEKSIIIFYSDHYPNLDILNDSRYFDSNKYEVPYVIYDNIGLEKNDKNLESYQLGSYLIDIIGYPQDNLTLLHNKFSNEEWYQEAVELLQYHILVE